MTNPPSSSPGNDGNADAPPSEADTASRPPLGAVGWVLRLLRSIMGGILLGLANVVPGVSGGTMLLAVGIYPKFVEALAEVTTFRFRRSSIAVLVVVGGCAVAAIVAAAGTIRPLVVDHRWVMYSLFIGLTLGGVPVLWRMLKPATGTTWVAAAIGLAGMVALAVAQAMGWGASGDEAASWWLLLAAGIAGASAMILPGISGAYLLLVMGVYLPILEGIDTVRQAVSDRDMDALIHPTLTVILPVGLGVVVGLVVVSNAVRFLLHRFANATLGVLLGLLVGAVVGLWPFQAPVKPEEGDIVRGRVMTPETIAALDPEKYPTAFYAPEAWQVLAALALIAVGFAVTAGLARLAATEEQPENEART